MFEQNDSINTIRCHAHRHDLKNETNTQRLQRIRKNKNIRKEKVSQRRNQLILAQNIEKPNLTRQQRKQHQKEKNRLAAQNSRDRQRKYLQDLQQENMQLKKQVELQLCRKCKAQMSEHSTSEEQHHDDSSNIFLRSPSIEPTNSQIDIFNKEQQQKQFPLVRINSRNDFQWGNIGRYFCIFLLILGVVLLSSSVEHTSETGSVKTVARILTQQNPICSQAENNQCPVEKIINYKNQQTWPFKEGTGQSSQQCKNNFWQHYLQKAKKQLANPYQSNLVTCNNPNLIHISTVFQQTVAGKWTFLITDPTVSNVIMQNDGNHHLESVNYLEGVYQLVAQNVRLTKVLGKTCLT